MRLNIVDAFVADSTGKRGVACDHYDVLAAAAQVASNSHTKRRGKRGPSVARAVAIVLAFRTEKKTVEAADMAHMFKTVEPAGKYFVPIALVTHIHHEAVARRVEHAMQRNRQLNYPEIRPEMTASLRKDFDQFIADFLRELWQILFAKGLDVGGRTDSVQQTRWRACRLGSLRILRRV